MEEVTSIEDEWAAIQAAASAAQADVGPQPLVRQRSLMDDFDLDASRQNLMKHSSKQEQRTLIRQQSQKQLKQMLKTFANGKGADGLQDGKEDDLDLGLGPPVALTRSSGTGTETYGLMADNCDPPTATTSALENAALDSSPVVKRSRTEMSESPSNPLKAQDEKFDFFAWADDDGAASASLSGGLHGDGRRAKKRKSVVPGAGAAGAGTSTNAQEISTSESDDEREHDGDEYSSVARQRNSKHLRGLYEITDYLGHGAYGHVYKATCKRTGDKVAIKRIVGIWDDLTHAKRLLRELRILRELNQPNIIEMRHILEPYPSINKFKDLWIVFEHADTDLRQLMQSEQFFSTLHIQYFLYQLLLGVHFMHTGQIVHRDLKPANILANSDCNLKICDFGLARGAHLVNSEDTPAADHPFLAVEPGEKGTASSARALPVTPMPSKNNRSGPPGVSPTAPPLVRQLTKHVQTRWYRAPELILMSNNYTSAIDMWSVGCILAELFGMQRESNPNYRHRKALFPGRSCFPLSGADMQYKDKMDQLNVIFSVIGTPSAKDIQICPEESRVYLKQLPHKSPERLQDRYTGADVQGLDMLRKLLKFNPAERMTAKQALRHPFLKPVVDPKMEAKCTSRPIDFEFEDIILSKQQIKALVQAEIIHFNPHLVNEIPASAIRVLSELHSTPLSPSASPMQQE